MAAGTAAAANTGGGSNPMNPAGGFMKTAMGRAAQQVLGRKNSAAGARTQNVGGQNSIQKARFGSIESRLDALEGGGEGGDSAQSVQPIQKFVQGGSFGQAPTLPPAPVASGTLNASAPPGSLDEAMPSPGDPAADMFGSEFMRNASVGAARMRKNKKL